MPSNWSKIAISGLIASIIASTALVYISYSHDFSHLDHYQVLNVQPRANAIEIRKAYRGLSLLYHPDKLPNSDFATRRFHRISEAYETLHDEESRRNYDMQIFGMDKVPFRIAPMLKQVGISWPSGQLLSLMEYYMTNSLLEWVGRCREMLTLRIGLAAFVLLGSLVFLLEIVVKCGRKVYDWFRFTGQGGIASGPYRLLVRDEALLAARLRQQQSLMKASKEKQDKENKKRSDAIKDRICRKRIHMEKREELLRQHRAARDRQVLAYQRDAT